MANPKYVQTDDRVIVTWSNLQANEANVPHIVRNRPDLVAVQFEGTWGNATATIQGSLSNVGYQPATDMKQTAISVSANAGYSVLEPYIYWQPTITGNAQTNVTVTIAYWTQR
jgi:type 1 fimbria pilin